MNIIHKLLLLFPPELSHKIVIFILKLYGAFGRPKIRSSNEKIIFKLSFNNIVGLAAGFDKNAEIIAAAEKLGFGFIEVGTITPYPQLGNPKPRLFRLRAKKAILNHMGFNNCGVGHARRNILNSRDKIENIKIFANIGKNKTTPIEEAHMDYKKCFEVLYDCVDGFVINISSPNTALLTTLQSVDFLKKIEPFCPKILPVLVKLSSDIGEKDFNDICFYVRDSNVFSGLVLVNTSSELAIEFGYSEGGISGKPIFEKAINKVRLGRNILGSNKTIIGVGGIFSLKDAIMMKNAGADLIEIYSGLIYSGPKLIRNLSEGLK